MSISGARVGASAFVPAEVMRIAPKLGDDIHLWWLPYRRSAGRRPLKAILAAYLGIAPEVLALIDNAYGRPAIAGPFKLDFNWSHSGDHAMLAIARGLPELGVDIEQYRARPHALGLAQRFFADSESAMLQRLPEAERSRAFIRLWTAKEAALKAHGRGLAYGLERIVFTLDDSGAQPLHFSGDIGQAEQWRFRHLLPAPDLSGTVAWHGAPRQLLRFRMSAHR